MIKPILTWLFPWQRKLQKQLNQVEAMEKVYRSTIYLLDQLYDGNSFAIVSAIQILTEAHYQISLGLPKLKGSK